jgi:RNA polymerase sigma-70 factor (ECF subfamily)
LEARELVQKVLQGDAKAAQEFVERYRGYMYKTCSNILGYRDPDAEDMVQEAFIVAFRKLPEFELRTTLEPWLAQICVFLCYQHIRKRQRMISKMDEDLETLAVPTAVARQESLDEENTRKEKVAFLDKCLGQISEECRKIIELREKEEKAYADIGKIMKIPIGTVMSRLSRCKQALMTLAQGLLKGEQNG